MNLKTVVIAVLCISCAAAGGHERKKWMEWKEPDKECDEQQSEPEFPQVGSVPGTPGVDFPSFTEIPSTTFTCADQNHVPGFYPDLETGCQVFHVCYQNRRESFLCPVGTIFSAPLKTCDYWYSAECLESPRDEESIFFTPTKKPELMDPIVEEIINVMLEKEVSGPKGRSPTKSTGKHPKSPSKYADEQSTSTESSKRTTKTPSKPDFPEKPVSHLPSKKDLQHEDKQVAFKDSAKKSDVTSTIKDATEIASIIMKSLLPVKSKVVDLIVEQSKKSKSEGSSKEDKEKPSKTTTTEASTVKPKITTSTTPRPRVVPQFRPAIPARVKLPVKAKPVWQQPLKKPVFPTKPVTHHTPAKGLPVSMLTKKQLALNYAKLWKLKKLGSPLMGLLKAV